MAEMVQRLLSLILCAAFAFVVAAEPQAQAPPWPYRTWARVNREPLLMEPAVSILCAPSTASPMISANPHRKNYFTVYVNEAGRHSMLLERSPSFPVGSIIIKEKLSSKDSDKPELLTAMLKREPGFNPASGDWEYMVLDGSGSKVVERGKLERCQSCHAANPKSDYVFRTYLSSEARSQLK